MARAAASPPDHIQPFILSELLVATDQVHVFFNGRCDNHPIEWVTMMFRKAEQPENVIRCKRQDPNPEFCQSSLDVPLLNRQPLF